MRLKLIVKDNEAILMTENNQIIEGVVSVNYDLDVDDMGRLTFSVLSADVDIEIGTISTSSVTKINDGKKNSNGGMYW